MLTTLPTLADTDFAPTSDADAGFGALRTDKGVLPLVALDLRTRIDGLIASVEMTQTFVNTHPDALEATYIFPLPDRAAVTSFRLEVAGRVVEGELQERGQARRTFHAAIQAGHRAAIAEEERAGVFTMRVGNLPPGERAIVRLSLVGPVPYSDGEATFRFPLVVAPRYIPGAALPGPSAGDGVAVDTDSVPDASRISPPVLLPGFPNPVRLSITVEVADSALKPHSFRSSLHTLIEEDSPTTRRFRVQPGERLDRDFLLRWRVAGDTIGTSLVVRPDAAGEEGTFLLTLVPPAHLGEQVRPRDIIFVLDRSGSMSGWKMVAARRAVARMVETLTEHDRFTVYAFDDQIETPPGFDGVALVPASDRQRFRAEEFLTGVDARGGTEMAEPLQKAIEELNRAGASANVDRILVLITDGQVGNEDEILRRLAPHVANVRIFTLGIDRAVNAAFLRRLADLGRGVSEVVESEQRLDEVMDQVHRHTGTPLLTGLALADAGLHIVADSVVPSRLPDLFAGAPMVLAGRYHGSPNGAVVLRGVDGEGKKWAGEVAAVVQAKAPLGGVYGRGRVRELEDRYAVQTSGRTELEREIVGTSLKFGVLSRFTAYVAVDRVEVVNPGGEGTKVTQAVESPAGWGEMEALAAQPATMAAGYGGYGIGGAAAPPAPCAAPPSSLTQARQVLRDGLLRATTVGGIDRLSSSGKLHEATASTPADGCELSLDADDDFDDAEDNGVDTSKEEIIRRMTRSVGPTGARKREDAPAKRKKADSGGMWQRVKDFFGVGEAKTEAALDCAEARKRVETLRSQLEGAGSDSATRLAMLRKVQAELTDVVRVLLAGGDTSSALLELSKHVSGLAQMLAPAHPADDVVNRYHEGIVLALRQWLGLPDAAAPAGREGFWK